VLNTHNQRQFSTVSGNFKPTTNKNKQNMEELILQQFEKQNSKAGHILMMRNLQFGLFQKLNPKQQAEAENAINSLIEKGYIVYEDGKSGPECIRLTDIGFNQLYKNSKSIVDIENLIMKEFEKQHSKAGHILMMKNLNFGLLQNFNPIEKDLFEPAVNNLISKELITYESGSPECLRLTEKGYETLY
jgi:hypothetical protein